MSAMAEAGCQVGGNGLSFMVTNWIYLTV